MPQDLWPKWLQERSKSIRDDFLADYVSFDAQRDLGEEPDQIASLLLLTQGSLEGYRLSYRRRGNESRCVFQVSLVPLGAITAVEKRLSVDQWVDGGTEREHSGSIHLNRGLGDWGTDIDLPLSGDDYGGSKKAADAAGKFLDALQRQMGSARPK